MSNNLRRNAGVGRWAKPACVLAAAFSAVVWLGALRLRPSTPQSARWVSIIQLIATPERFDGAHVRLMGFAHFAFEGTVLFLHREDFESTLLVNGVWLDVVPEEYRDLSDTYVMVEGQYKSRGTGPLEKYAGEITAITRLERLPSRSEILVPTE